MTRKKVESSFSGPLGRFVPALPWAPGIRTLWLLAIGMLGFGAAELPALATMSAHGTSVLGFELAGSMARLHAILARWGAQGRAAAEQHVLLDSGFIVCYGLLLMGICARLASSLSAAGRRSLPVVATLLGWGALVAATANLAQKVILWIELHQQATAPLPALAAACDTAIFALVVPAVLFAAVAAVLMRCERSGHIRMRGQQG
jgi:hypothetical protein